MIFILIQVMTGNLFIGKFMMKSAAMKYRMELILPLKTERRKIHHLFLMAFRCGCRAPPPGYFLFSNEFRPPLSSGRGKQYGYIKDGKTYFKNIVLTNNKTGKNINDRTLQQKCSDNLFYISCAQWCGVCFHCENKIPANNYSCSCEMP